MVLYMSVFFFFKQKTAYEMRISDWSSDVCSSDLSANSGCGSHAGTRRCGERGAGADVGVHQPTGQPAQPFFYGTIHALGHASTQHDLAQQNEHRDRYQDEICAGRPENISGGPI